MWLTLTERDGDRLVATLDSWAVFAFLDPGEVVECHVDDSIDCILEDEEEDAASEVVLRDGQVDTWVAVRRAPA